MRAFNAMKRVVRKRCLPINIPRLEAGVSMNAFVTFGLMRSGQHLILDWIGRGARSLFHYNNCRIERSQYQYEVFPYERLPSEYGFRVGGPITSLYSFEDRIPTDILFRRVAKQLAAKEILFLRDPFNWFASSLRHGHGTRERLTRKVQLLKLYLRIALAKQNDFTVISYNQFITDREYRFQLAHELELQSFDSAEEAMNCVPAYGGGSSFAGVDTDVQPTDVLNRWRTYLDDPFFYATLNDPELLELSGAFFGDSVVAFKEAVDRKAA